jgi:hypothetical protein
MTTVSTSTKYPANITRNQKYSIVSFIPVVFYEQFKFFFNLYFLLVALSQFIPALKIGMYQPYQEKKRCQANHFIQRCRLHRYVYRSSGFRPICDDGQRSTGRLPAVPP